MHNLCHNWQWKFQFDVMYSKCCHETHTKSIALVLLYVIVGACYYVVPVVSSPLVSGYRRSFSKHKFRTVGAHTSFLSNQNSSSFVSTAPKFAD